MLLFLSIMVPNYHAILAKSWEISYERRRKPVKNPVDYLYGIAYFHMIESKSDFGDDTIWTLWRI